MSQKTVKTFGSRVAGSAMPRVLLVDSDLASRLTLRTILEAAGYVVESATSFDEARGLMESSEYNLVLSDAAEKAILEYARGRENAPATARITSFYCVDKVDPDQQIALDNQDISRFLDHVAALIGRRATRRVAERRLWQAPLISPIC